MNMLLCDFHIHTKFSDGLLSLKDVIDLYGQACFDVIAITDHIVNGDTLLGKAANKLKYSITKDSFNKYFDSVKLEAERAYREYEMIVICGIEITKTYVDDENRSAHFILLDLTEFIPAYPNVDEILYEAKKQNCITIACHPYRISKEIGGTKYLQNNRDKYRNIFDLQELGNNVNFYSLVKDEGLPFVGNSDFHNYKDLFSYKTLLNCPKRYDDIRNSLKNNLNIRIHYYG